MAWYRRFVVCWESFVPGGPIGAACWESFIPVRSAGFRVGRVLSRVAHWGCLLGEFYTGSARRVSCGESFVPEVVLCAVQSSPCSACLCRRREIVLPASEKWLGIAVLWCVGRVLSRSSGETARSEGVRGLRGMYLRCRRAAARLESGARPAGPGRASRRRAERSSRRGRRAGGQASRRTEVWRGAPSEARWDGGCGAGGHGRPIGGWCEACRAWPGFEATRRAKLAARSASGRAGFAPHGDLAGLAPHGGLATGCLADGERAGRRPPAHRADADNRMCWA